MSSTALPGDLSSVRKDGEALPNELENSSDDRRSGAGFSEADMRAVHVWRCSSYSSAAWHRLAETSGKSWPSTSGHTSRGFRFEIFSLHRCLVTGRQDRGKPWRVWKDSIPRRLDDRLDHACESHNRPRLEVSSSCDRSETGSRASDLLLSA
jgi:hypothetical protein